MDHPKVSRHEAGRLKMAPNIFIRSSLAYCLDEVYDCNNNRPGYLSRVSRNVKESHKLVCSFLTQRDSSNKSAISKLQFKKRQFSKAATDKRRERYRKESLAVKMALPNTSPMAHANPFMALRSAVKR